MTNMDPLDLPLTTQGVRDAVKAIADHPVDASDAGREKFSAN
jgi:hypothetical protein